jgi:hypothetical protein
MKDLIAYHDSLEQLRIAGFDVKRISDWSRAEKMIMKRNEDGGITSYALVNEENGRIHIYDM